MTDEEKIKLENKIAFLENTVTIMQQRLKSLGKKYSEDLEKVNGELLKILQLQKENAALRARLDKAVELPVKVGDTVYLLSQTSRCPAGEIVEAKIIDFIGWEDGYRFTAKGGREWFSFLIGDIGTWVFTTREAAEARLKELERGG